VVVVRVSIAARRAARQDIISARARIMQQK
jgi:hypothetical protein